MVPLVFLYGVIIIMNSTGTELCIVVVILLNNYTLRCKWRFVIILIYIDIRNSGYNYENDVKIQMGRETV